MAKTILIIDDDPVTVHWLSRHLGSEGFEILTAFNGVEGLEKARQFKPDFIMLDVMMPELNGYSVCGFLRTDKDLFDVPIVMITSRCGESDSKFDNHFSPNAFFTKPLDIDSVSKTIAELL